MATFLWRLIYEIGAFGICHTIRGHWDNQTSPNLSWHFVIRLALNLDLQWRLMWRRVSRCGICGMGVSPPAHPAPGKEFMRSSSMLEPSNTSGGWGGGQHTGVPVRVVTELCDLARQPNLKGWRVEQRHDTQTIRVRIPGLYSYKEHFFALFTALHPRWSGR